MESSYRDTPSVESQALLKSLLQPGESVVRQAAVSYGIYWKGLALLLFGLLILVPSFTLGVYFLAASIVVLLIEYGLRRNMLLAATDKRVIVRYGLINLQRVDVPFRQIQSVETVTTPMGRLLGYATVILSGTGGLFIPFPFVADAAAFGRDLTFAMSQKQEEPVPVINVPPPPDAPRPAA
jgi:uncharacterized membrane protein YdbT with pleckstrin-like domain